MASSPRVPTGPAPDPVVQRLRVRYAKRGRMRFTSSRDFQRALERAVRRAGLPMAFSAGFHPHPKISYANAAPTGAGSEAEYVELGLDRVVDVDGVAPALDAALPEGLDVVSVEDITDERGPLADLLEGSQWELRFRGAAAPGLDDLRAGLVAGVEALLAQETHLVSRMMKKGLRELDVRAALLDLAVQEEAPADAPGEVVLRASVRHTTPTVRPEELWTALRQVSGRELPRPVSTRLRQGPVEDSVVVDHLGRAGV